VVQFGPTRFLFSRIKSEKLALFSPPAFQLLRFVKEPDALYSACLKTPVSGVAALGDSWENNGAVTREKMRIKRGFINRF